MKPLLATVVALSLALIVHALPENIEDVKELPQSKEPIVEAEESKPQARIERCTTCGLASLKVKSPQDILAALQALPASEVHTQQSFEGCSSDKGCAGLKLKDGKIVERYGNVDAYNAAAAADVNNEFNFHSGFGKSVLDGANPPFWWMNKDSPFKAGAANSFGKYSKSSSASYTSSGSSGDILGGSLDLAGNPFLNGNFAKLNAAQSVAGVKPTNFQSSSYEASSYSSSNKGDFDLTNNPFLNGGFKAGAAGAVGGAGYQNAFTTGEAAQGFGISGAAQGFGANAVNSQNSFAANAANSQSSFAANAANAQSSFAANAANSQNFGGSYGAGLATGSRVGIGYTGSSPTPFATPVSNVNLIQSEKASEFDYEQQQQTQQNIDSIFQSAGSIGLDTSGGDLQQTCAAEGYSCVLKTQCSSGVAVLRVNPRKQYCNVRTEICCRVEIYAGTTSAVGSSVNQGSYAGSTFGAQAGTFGAQGSTFDAQGQSTQNAFGSSIGLGATDVTTSLGGRGTYGAGQTTSFGSNIGSVNRGVGYTPTITPGQTNYIETDSLSAGSDTIGIYRPGAIGSNLKPGVPYLPPVDNSNSGTNIVSSTAFPTPTFVSTPRPVTKPIYIPPPVTKPAYIPPPVTKPAYIPPPVTKPAYIPPPVTKLTYIPPPVTKPVYIPPPVTKPAFIPPPVTRPTYIPPPISSTSAPGYLPPVGEQTINRETIVPSPNPTNSDGSLILDETRPPVLRPTPPPVASEIPAGCAAALKCTPIEFCTAEGVVSNTTVILTREQDAYRVPLTDCRDIETGRIGKCCRDPFYTDPWPTNQLGKWVPGVFGGNDGKYVPDSRGSSNNIRPIVTARPPVTGSVLLNNFKSPKPTLSPFGPNQVTPGYSTSPVPQKTPISIGGQGQYGIGGQGQYSIGGQDQYTSGGQGQYGIGSQGQLGVIGQGQIGSGSQVSTAYNQGVLGQKGQGQIISQGTGQVTKQGQGQFVTQGQGQIIKQGQGQFAQGGRGQIGLVGQGTQTQFGVGQKGIQGSGVGLIEGQGQLVGQGQGTAVAQGLGAGIRQGQGAFVSQGQGAVVSQGVGTGILQGQGLFATQGQGTLVNQGQGAIVGQGQGGLVRQGQGAYINQGQGALVSQGQGQLVSQGQGQLINQGQGQLATQGQGAFVSRGQGQYVSQGEGQLVSQGQGQYLSQGQGQLVTRGQGLLVSQGFGQSIRQGQGFGVENEYSESVHRVFLQQYNGGGGKCGLLNGQRPYGNHANLEVDFAEIPWQAMVLLQTNKSLLCGGVITRPDVVVTSAACVDGLDAKNVLIKGGEWKLGIDDEPLPFQIVQVKTIIRHPLFQRGSLLYDAAILVLAENLRFAKNIYPICLPGADENLDAFYGGAGQCIVTGWGKQVLQAHLAGSIMHSLNVSLITPNECQAKLTSDYPHLLDQYDKDSCVCGQPTNPLDNICRVDIGSALACTTGNGQFVLRGVYSWDSGCQVGNQIAAFYRFDLEWYQWAIGLVESVRFAKYTTTKVTSQISGGVKGFTKGSQFSGVKGSVNSGVKGFGVEKTQFGFGQGVVSQGITKQLNQFAGKISSGGSSQSKFEFSEIKPISNGFSATYSEKKVFQSEPKIITYTTKPEIITYTTKPEIVTYTTKPEIVTFTTKPEIFTFTTKPKIVTYTTKPKIITYTTKPQIVTYETSGSGTNPQYVAPGVTFNPSFSEIVNKHQHSAKCKCLEGKK